MRLWRQDAELWIEVEDDGDGVPPNAPEGVGLPSLRARVAELGGRLTLDRPPRGGTRLAACIPGVAP